jgi:hypothetical protein
MISLPFREAITKILNNPKVVSLLSTKKCNIDANTEFTLEGSLDSSISFENNSIVITYHNAKAKITYRPTTWINPLKVDGRLDRVTIMSDKIVLAISGLPDQTIILT